MMNFKNPNITAVKNMISFAEFLTISNDDDCDKLVSFAHGLSEKVEHGDNSVRHLLELVIDRVEKYEDEHFSLPSRVTPESMMKHLMEEHGHSQLDMKDVAPRPVINMIVNGKRKLTREHIEKLCKKYNVTGEWFYG